MEYADDQIKKAQNPLTKTLLRALKFEAEKHCIIQQMIVDSVKKEAVHLSPEELRELSSHLNRFIEEEEKALTRAKAFEGEHEPYVTRFLMSYLVADLRSQNSLLKEFDDELKIASVPTSASSKRFTAASV